MLICCVPNCSSRFETGGPVKFHRFPYYDKELCMAWLQRIGDPNLIQLGVEGNLRKRICHLHFHPMCLLETRKGLKDLSLPILQIYNLNLDATPANCFFQRGISTIGGAADIHSEEVIWDPVVDHSYAAPALLPASISIDYDRVQPSTSRSYDSSPPLKLRIVQAPQKEASAGSSPETPPDQLIPAPDSNASTPTPFKSIKDVPKKRNLLRTYKVSRASKLSPRRRKFYRSMKNLRRHSRQLYIQKKGLENRLAMAESMATKLKFTKSLLNNATYNFLSSQLVHQGQKARGRRYNIRSKIFALTLLKQSPKAYRLLQKIFALPSRQTLTSLLRKVSFYSGINPHIMADMKKTVSKMTENEKICCLVFDEMSISNGLTYNFNDDIIHGFEDTGVRRERKLADHALVFMACGLMRKWKQPICYYLLESGMKQHELASTIKQVITALQGCLKVVASVCDQLSTNAAATKLLKEETNARCLRLGKENRYFGYCINDEEIVPIFDPPHLLKGLRNNFLDNSVVFTMDGEEKTGRWSDIKQLYDADVGGEGEFRLLERLTEGHVVASQMKKMKVNIAAQVFSRRVGGFLKKIPILNDVKLSETAVATGEFLLFGNSLFDSVNGSALHPHDNNPMRRAISPGSPHVKFWRQAEGVLRTVRFVTASGRSFQPPTVRNWIETIKGFRYLWSVLRKNHLTSFLCTRNINQDPLENFFGSIRSHGVRNINPTSTSVCELV